MNPATHTTRSTCPYCGVGCGVLIHTQQTPTGIRITGVEGDPAHPANHGRLCSKGSRLADTAQPLVYQQVRASQPMLRTHRSQAMQATDWDTALQYTVQRFADLIEQHGPDSVAFYISGQLLTEDYYVFNKLAKGLIGTNNIDTNSRLCMSSAVSGYKRTLGADAPPCSYTDIDTATCVFIAGSNMAYAHPVLYRRLELARAANPNHTVVVIDPRQTDTAQAADLHLQLLPGTDVMLFNTLLNIQIQEGWVDGAYISQHTEGFEAMARQLASYTPELAASVCGLKVSHIEKAAQWFAWGGKAGTLQQPGSTLSLYCQGLNQATTGTDKNTALIALHLATGHIGKPGAGPFSLTGQPNAMGGREVGGMATLLPAHRELANPTHRAETAAFWGVRSISPQPGATATELFERLESGHIKAVWIACTNPAHSMPNADQVQRALSKAELVVVQDAYLTPATVGCADVLLPATTWAEKEGTVTNSERRITRVRAALPAWGQSRHDWHIAAQFGSLLQTEIQQRRGMHSNLLPSSPPLFAYSGPEAVFNEHRATTAGQDLDITGLDYALLDQQGPQQWPLPAGHTQGQARLYIQGQFATANSKAQFVFAPYMPVAEDADARYPWRLNTGRLRDQWHGGSRTGSLAVSFAHQAEPAVHLNPADCQRLKLKPNDWVQVRSRRGMLYLPAEADPSVPVAQAYIPMHWGPEFTGGRKQGRGVNALTLHAVDPYSKQPELKHAAVQLQASPWAWSCVAFVRSHMALMLWQQLRQFHSQFDVVVCTPMATQTPAELAHHLPTDAVLFRALCATAPSTDVLQQLAGTLGLLDAQADLLQYSDARTGELRLMRLHTAAGQTTLQAVLLTGNLQSQAWLRTYFTQATPVGHIRARLLSGQATAPLQVQTAGKLVCNCVGVSQNRIQTVLAQQAAQCPNNTPIQQLQALQSQLGCGTQCGSCVPELKQLIAAQGVADLQ